MAAAATAAAQPGVSVVSMSWGFPEGQSITAADEAQDDPIFDAPGVTFLASTGDYGAADPEYPAFSPDVVAVGGTTLTLNADDSYNSETGWGSTSGAGGLSVGSGGGISLYEPEPAYQQGVQSTGYRTTPDVALVADPDTGVWIADPYNLDPSDPFEVVGGTSLSAPAWAGLVALVDQGRAAAGEPALNASGPGEAQQALYSLPEADYNAIDGGNNGYTGSSGYNLVTGLGTPIAGRLVSDLIAYAGTGTSYPGPKVGPLQAATLAAGRTAGGEAFDVFSVFDAMPAAGTPAAVTPAASITMATAATIPTPTAPLPAAAAGPVGTINGAAPLAPPSGTIARPSSASPIVATSAHTSVAAGAETTRSAVFQAIGEVTEGGVAPIVPRRGRPADILLDELIADPALVGVACGGQSADAPAAAAGAVESPTMTVIAGGRPAPVPGGPLTQHGASRPAHGAADLIMAIGFCGSGAGLLAARAPRSGGDGPDGCSRSGGRRSTVRRRYG